MTPPRCILEINTRVWLRRLGGGESLPLKDVPQSALDEWADRGFDAVWLMGIWLPSEASRRIAVELSFLKTAYSQVLPDWKADDVSGSPYAIGGYQVNPLIGDDAALAEFRERLCAKNIRLILDFVPNHTARDHPWLSGHSGWYVIGTADDIEREPANWFWAQTDNGMRAVAHGRDPHFRGWSDTAQLDYSHPELQAKMRGELLRLADRCDGARCDMAMLVLSSVFEKTWGRKGAEFWPKAIESVRAIHPDFCFVAEVYWGLEGELRPMGFDLTYDKKLLDEIVSGNPLRRDAFEIPESEQRARLRFLENHDEPRIASRLDRLRHRAAAVWTFCLPSSRLFYDGQPEGQTVQPPVQLVRLPFHPPEEIIRQDYQALLAVLKRDAVRNGTWNLLTPVPAWTGNESYRAILGQAYDRDDEHVRIFVNWSDARSQCWVPLGIGPPSGREFVLRDLLSPKQYVRNGLELSLRGLYLDLDPWEAQIFDCTVQSAGS